MIRRLTSGVDLEEFYGVLSPETADRLEAAIVANPDGQKPEAIAEPTSLTPSMILDSSFLIDILRGRPAVSYR